MGDIFNREATAEDLLQNHYLAYPDMDASPTKVFLMANRDAWPKHFDYAFANRPAFELYDLKADPDQLNNVASNRDYKADFQRLSKRLMRILKETRDPRVMGDGSTFDSKPFVDPEFVPPPKRKKVLEF